MRESPIQDLPGQRGTSRQTKVARISEHLKRLILEGTYPPGSRIEAERLLTTKFEVNRSTMNKVMAMLAAERLVRRFPGRGTFVVSPEERQLGAAPIRKNCMAFAFFEPLRQMHNSQFYAQILDGVYGEALRAGYRLLLEYAPEAKRLLSGPAPEVDGLLAVAVEDPPVLAGWRQAGVPVVCCDFDDPSGAFDSAVLDHAAAAEAIVEHLVARGKRRIGMINEQLHPYRFTQSAREREAGLRAALARRGLGLPEEAVAHIAARDASGVPPIRRFLARPDRPDAVVLFHAPFELPLLAALRELGLSCPKDLAVATFVQWESATPVTPDMPRLCGARFSAETLGAKAAALLIRRIQQPTVPVERFLLRPEFEPGESV